MKRDGYRCVRCSETRDLTIDHIKPIALGGSYRVWNLQVLCQPCNVAKGDSDPLTPGG